MFDIKELTNKIVIYSSDVFIYKLRLFFAFLKVFQCSFTAENKNSADTGIDADIRVKDLTEEQEAQLRDPHAMSVYNLSPIRTASS